MFSPKIHVTEMHDDADPKPTIHGEGNANLIDGGWNFPGDLGMSRADLYPSKHQRAWYTRLAERWVI